ncbi:MAG: glycerophosphodiester phosphodiesterase family protein [Microbacteriaceae bacterium]
MKNNPMVIAHRGASGYRPEHTREAYLLALELGAEALEPDIVVSRDGVPVIRHENELSETTDIAERPEFADRKTTKELAGFRFTGWFVEDFSWDELQTLEARERIPQVRPENTRYTGAGILRLGELIELVHAWTAATGSQITLVIELKHASYFSAIGLDLEPILLKELQDFGWISGVQESRLVIESFELPILKRLKHSGLDAEYIFLLEAEGAPLDEMLAHGTAARPFADFLTETGLRELKNDIDGVSVDKSMILSWSTESGYHSSDLVHRVHQAGLKAYTWTLRPESQFLANPEGNAEEEFRMILDSGVDGVFADYPDLVLNLLDED